MNIITMEHGSGGRATSELINRIFASEFSNDVLNLMEDSAIVEGAGRIAVTTDSFVVEPLEFPGGDIGRLCICGTVNDLLMRGAIPKYITCGFILQEGLEIEVLQRIVRSMAQAAHEAGVMIVAGDTKVVEGCGGMYINTSGVGFVDTSVDISARNICEGDVVIVSGTMGDHHAVIQSMRMGIDNSILSDNAPLNEMVTKLISNNIELHALRDVTRGGLATVLKELAVTSGCRIEIDEVSIPVNPMVEDFCAILGLDPVYMGNEGKLVAVVSPKDADKALEIIRQSRYGEKAKIIGRVTAGEKAEIIGKVTAGEKAEIIGRGTEGESFRIMDRGATEKGMLVMNTSIGGRRVMDILEGEGLPRIC